MKILQIQSSGDEFFLPDNEVNEILRSQNISDHTEHLVRMRFGTIYK